MMHLHDLPHFTIEAVRDPDTHPALLGRFTTTLGVRDGRSWLYDGDQSLIGDVEGLDRSTGRATFSAPFWTLTSRAQLGASLPWVDGYWQAYHLTMILDPSNAWRQTTFVPTAAQYFLMNGSRAWGPVGQALPKGAKPLEVVAGGWDHEHCQLCWAKIGVHGAAVGYLDTSERWICETCFHRYAEPRDLSFLASE